VVVAWSLFAAAAAFLALSFDGVPARAASATVLPATAMYSLSVSLNPASAMMLSVSLLSTRVWGAGGEVRVSSPSTRTRGEGTGKWE
jgi:hypothetical protein